jgi:branched-chain amino acid transport system permease protein
MNFLLQTMNGLSFAALLFLLGSGFALTFGLLRIVNIMHGSAFLIGGYVGFSTIDATGSFWLALLAGAAAMGAAGFVIERGLLRRIGDNETAQFLLTMGIAWIAADFGLVIWGGTPESIGIPGFLSSSFHLGSITYPYIRVLICGTAIVIGIGLWLLLDRTRTGSIIRAGVDDREMVSALGINVGRVFTLVFVIGMFLAGLAGVLGGTVVPLSPSTDWDILIYVFAIVVIGGRGTLAGAVAGSLVVGLAGTYGQAYFPSFAYFSLFGPMVIVLLLRPQGVFGRGVV